jgi:hypothetical protein
MTPSIDRNSSDAIPGMALDQLAARVQGLLHGRVRALSLVVQGEGLVLRGCVPTYYAKQLAQHAVMKATPMPIVANEIEVH